MKTSFAVITDVAEIAKLNKQLGTKLLKTFSYRETREIGYPAGHFSGKVHFEHSSGKEIHAWAPATHDDKLINFFLIGEPGAQQRIDITVQLNFPRVSYNRRLAGAFVRDAHGDVFIAHRGRLTKGRSSLTKADVFREFAPRVIEAQDDGQTSDLILITSLDDKALADRLFEFALEAREVAVKLNAEGDQGRTATERVRTPQGSRPDSLLKLRAYFDEYAGEGQTKGHGGGSRTVEHGDIVKALELKLRQSGSTQKAQAIDLAVVSGNTVDLFEVKTSARTTDVYTGVGQLLIHGGCISDLLGLAVRRFLVLPAPPKRSHEPHITKGGAMQIVTFEKSEGGYRFKGL